MKNLELIQKDIGAILRSLGYKDTAYPCSCHELVLKKIIPEIKRIKRINRILINK